MKNVNLGAEDLFAALKEKNITAENFAAELKLILDDYFTGTSKLSGKTVTVDFLNGQRFKITVKKLKR